MIRLIYSQVLIKNGEEQSACIYSKNDRANVVKVSCESVEEYWSFLGCLNLNKLIKVLELNHTKTKR